MAKLAALLRLARPTFLLGGLAGYALGAAVAAYEGARITPLLYAAGQALVTAFHLMTHFANDYFDRVGDRHGRPSAFAGGSGVLVERTLAPRTALAAALLCATIGATGVGAFALARMPAAASIGALIGGLAWAYSAPPLRLVERGWGEIDATLVVAHLVPLAGYAVFSGRVDGLAVAATAGPACAMFALMLAVEWPDYSADVAGAKTNLVVRLGLPAAARLAAGAALLSVPGLWVAVACGAPATVLIFSLLLAPVVVVFARRIAMAGAPGAEIAARGVALFVLTVLFEALGYVAALT